MCVHVWVCVRVCMCACLSLSVCVCVFLCVNLFVHVYRLGVSYSGKIALFPDSLDLQILSKIFGILSCGILVPFLI